MDTARPLPQEGLSVTFLARARRLGHEGIHFWITGALAILLLPAARLAKLKLSPPFLAPMLIGIVIEAIFLASILHTIGFPASSVLRPLCAQKRRFLMALPAMTVMVCLLGWGKGTVLSVVIVAILEFVYRVPQNRGERFLTIVAPTLYFVLGVSLVYYFNAIIVSLRFYAQYDLVFNAMDRVLLFGATVPALGHWAATTLPVSCLQLLEFIYYGMFAQIGAGIVIAGLQYGRCRAFKLAGTILLAYYIALAIFAAVPSHGPYVLCPMHFREMPSTLETIELQKLFLRNASSLWAHSTVLPSGFGYYIAFPCMHITQPLIVLWYLRGWKRIGVFLLSYDVLLVLAIVLLEWHYVVDIIGGILLAVGCIWMIRDPRPGAREA